MNKQQRINHLQSRARSWRQRQYNGTYTFRQSPKKQGPVVSFRSLVDEAIIVIGLLVLGAILAYSLVGQS